MTLLTHFSKSELRTRPPVEISLEERAAAAVADTIEEHPEVVKEILAVSYAHQRDEAVVDYRRRYTKVKDPDFRMRASTCYLVNAPAAIATNYVTKIAGRIARDHYNDILKMSKCRQPVRNALCDWMVKRGFLRENTPSRLSKPTFECTVVGVDYLIYN